jgi:hypothetical protein
MQTAQLLTLSGRVRAALVAATASLVVLGTALPGPTMADQAPTSQTTAASQQPEKIGAHTHQLHGIVKTAPSSGSSTFVVTTERYGDVTVSFSSAVSNGQGHGHGHGHGRGSSTAHTQAASAADVKAGDRVIVQGSTDGQTFIARRVHVLQTQDAGQHATHLVGTITGVSTTNGITTLTVKLADGTSQSVTVSSASRIRPAGKTTADLTVGTKVTVVEKDGAATGGAATGVVVMPA